MARGRSKSSKRNRWTKEENMKLKRALGELDVRSGPVAKSLWKKIAKKFGNTRSSKDCAKRWRNHEDPTINKRPATDRERAIVYAAVKLWGNDYARISKLDSISRPGLQGRRTDTWIKELFEWMLDNLDHDDTLRAQWEATELTDEDALNDAAAPVNDELDMLRDFAAMEINSGYSGTAAPHLLAIAHPSAGLNEAALAAPSPPQHGFDMFPLGPTSFQRGTIPTQQLPWGTGELLGAAADASIGAVAGDCFLPESFFLFEPLMHPASSLAHSMCSLKI